MKCTYCQAEVSVYHKRGGACVEVDPKSGLRTYLPYYDFEDPLGLPEYFMLVSEGTRGAFWHPTRGNSVKADPGWVAPFCGPACIIAWKKDAPTKAR